MEIFAEENPTNVQAQPFTSTPVKPSDSQIQTQATAQAHPQAPVQAQSHSPAQAQPPRLAPAHLPQPQATDPLLVRQAPSDSLHDEYTISLWIF